MNYMNILLSVSEPANSGGFDWSSLLFIGYIVLLVAAMYFLLIRPQKKKQKKEEQLRNNIQVGDEIITIGGFYGRVMSVKDDDIVIESLGDKSKQRIAKWAVQQNLTIHDDEKTKK